jgi:bifunctional DNA-binding transcriptional regulator/antitoxin component of YhaV-PrlF toxin-antitoxin module
MPMSKWINNAQMIPEGKTYKVDSASRIAIPAHIRAKFGINTSDDMDYYTTFVDGKWFMCVTKHLPEETDETTGE